MQRVALEIRVDRQDVAFRELDHHRPPPHVIGGEVGPIVLAVRGDLADVRKGQAHDQRNQQEQKQQR